MAYRGLWQAFQTFRLAENACGCLAAGLLSNEDFHAARRIQWHELPASADRVASGLLPVEQRVYTRWFPQASRLLLIGCGAGRDLIGLAQLGHRVTGLEQAPNLADVGRQHLARLGIDASIEVGSVETAAIAGQYDAIVFGGASYSFLRGAPTRVATIERLKPHVSRGGLMVLNYLSAPDPPRRSVALMRLTARLAATNWQPEIGDAVRFLPGSGALGFVHYFRPGDVAGECARAGLRVVDEDHDRVKVGFTVAQLPDA